MSNPVQAGLSIVGAGIGFAIGGPFGAQLGFSLGGIAGSYISPTKLPGVSGPRLDNLNVMTSTVGAVVKQIHGTHAVGCEVLWSSGLIETKHTEEVGGKSNPPSQTQTSYTYAIDVAAAICGATEFGVAAINGIRRIWLDALCVYDARPQLDDETDEEFAQRLAATLQTQEILTVYLGTEDQLPDPTMESYLDLDGTGIQAYREIAYIVLTQLQLEKYGNRLPNIRVEAYNGTAVEEDCSGYSVGHMERWQYQIDGGVFDPRNVENQHFYKSCMGGLQTPNETFAVMKAGLAGAVGEFGNSVEWVIGEIPQVGDSIYTRGWAVSSTPNYSQPCDADDPSVPSLAVDRVTVTMNINTLREAPGECNDGSAPCIRDTLMYFGRAGDASGFYYRNLNNTGLPAPYPQANWDNRGDCPEDGTGITLQKWASFDQEICVRRWHAPIGCNNGTPIEGAEGFCIINGVVTRALTWTLTSGVTAKALRWYDDTGTFGVVNTYPIDPAMSSADPDYNNQSVWEAAYAAAVAANAGMDASDPNRIPEDWVYGIDYPEVRVSDFSSDYLWESSCSSPVVELDCIPVATVFRRILLQCGYDETEFDVNDIGSCMHGYCVDAPIIGREQLLPLMTAFLIDMVESQGVMKFVERGHGIVRTLTANDLAAHAHGTQRPSAMVVTRKLEDTLPRMLKLQYLSSERDYEPAEQPAFREGTTDATEDLIIRLPIPMTDLFAAELANVLLYNMWVERTVYRTVTYRKHLDLEPTDCIGAPVDDEVKRMRITSASYSMNGVYVLDMVEDDDGAYVPVAVAQAPAGSGVGNSPGGGLVCDSEAILLDLPSLRAGDTDAGYYWATRGYCDSWRCASLWRSNDEGETYVQVGTTTAESTIGLITAADIAGGSGGYVELELQSGNPLSSATAAAIANGVNLAAVGGHGHWCLIQFETAVLGTDDRWTLTNITSGLFGTSAFAGGITAGDRFVLLDNNVRRVAESPVAIGVTKQFKIVSCDQSVDAVTPFTFTTQGLSYHPGEAPTTVISQSVQTPPTDPQDGDCYLIPINDTSVEGDWAEHGGQIACWSDIAQDWIYTTPDNGTHIYIADEDIYVQIDLDGNVSLPAWHKGKQQWCGTISPASISSSQNDYNPTGLETASGLRLTATGAVDITGLAGGECGRMMLIHNIGSNTITLKDEGGASAAENRFALSSDVELDLDQSTLLQYDEVSLRWRVIGGVGTSTPGSGQVEIQWQDESVNLGLPGDIDIVNFTGGLTASVDTTGTLTVRGGDVSGPSSATDNAIARFDGATGKLLQNSATLLSDADELTTPNVSAAEVGFKGIPQNNQTGNYTLLLTDASKTIYKDSGGTVTVTIPANSSVAFPVGTQIEIINDDTELLTIAITTDTLVLSPSGATGSRTLARYGIAVIKKIASTRWLIAGVGVT